MKELLLTDVCANLNFIHSRNVTLKGSIRHMIKNKNLVFDYDVFLPDYGFNLQRDLVWTLEQKQECILSVLKGLSLGNFHFLIIDSENRNETVQVIDGKQRLNAIFDFINRKFAINVKGVDYYFDNLSDYAKQRIYNFAPTGDIAYSHTIKVVTDKEKIAWFVHVNFKGTPQDKQYLTKIEKLL